MWWSIIAFGIFGGIILWQLATGIALDGKWRVWYRRVENPREYWQVVGGQMAAVLFLWLVWSWAR